MRRGGGRGAGGVGKSTTTKQQTITVATSEAAPTTRAR